MQHFEVSDTLPDEPEYGYDVYVQRLSVYIQIKDEPAKTPSELDLKDPYALLRKMKKEFASNGDVAAEPIKIHKDETPYFDNGTGKRYRSFLGCS